MVNNETDAFEAVSHLVRLGHRRVGLIVASLDLSTSTERREGYRRALREHGLLVEDDLVHSGESRPEAGHALVLDLLGSDAPPTALFVGNNVMTMGALTAVQALGLRIPDALSIVGFDDPPWAQLVSPPLTTVRQPTFEIGRTAADLLLRRIGDPNREPETIVLPTTLVVRGSCGAPASADGRA